MKLCECEQKDMDVLARNLTVGVEVFIRFHKLCPIGVAQAYADALAKVCYTIDEAVGAPPGATLQEIVNGLAKVHNDASETASKGLKDVAAFK